MENAGECWANSGDHRQAAETFLKAEQHTRAAQLYFQGMFFNEMVEVLRAYGHNIEAKIQTTLMNDARKSCFRVRCH